MPFVLRSIRNTQTQCKHDLEFLNFEPDDTESNGELYKIQFPLRGEEMLASILIVIS
jgi:hypothetical protein